MMSNPIIQTRILYYTVQEYCTLNISVNYHKSVDVGKPFIHYIAVKVTNNVGRKSLD